MRRFNKDALSEFKSWIDSPDRQEADLEVHAGRLYSDEWTERVPDTADIPPALRSPETCYELGNAVCVAMRDEDRALLMEDEALMCWLSVLFRNALFYKKGAFYVGNRHRFLFPDASSPRTDLRRRHLVRTRILMVTEHGKFAEGILSTPPNGFSKLEEQHSSRADASFAFLRSGSFFEAVTLMYVTRGDDGRARLRPGTHMSFERLVVVGSQLDSTFDLGSMDARDIVHILPAEFGRFKRNVT